MPMPIAAIVLAAGRSTRMGRCKQLLPLAERPALQFVLEGLTTPAVTQTAVVLGPQGKRVAKAIEIPNVTLVSNPDPRGDMASSVLAGLAALQQPYAAVLIALADMPLVRSSTIDALIHSYQDKPCAILVPTYHGRGGHPTLFDHQTLSGMRPSETLRDLRARHLRDTRQLAVDDPGIRLDMDTPQDYQRLYALKQQQRSQ